LSLHDLVPKFIQNDKPFTMNIWYSSQIQWHCFIWPILFVTSCSLTG